MHVFHQRAHKGREVFTFSSQTSSINGEVILQTPLGPIELKCTFFLQCLQTLRLFRPQKDNSWLNFTCGSLLHSGNSLQSLK